MPFLAQFIARFLHAFCWKRAPKPTPVEEFLNDEITADELWRDFFERCWELESHTKG